MEPGKYVVEIHKDTGIAGGIPPYWFWSVSFDMFIAKNVAFTKWGAKRAAARYINNREKSRKSQAITYEINL